VTVPPLRIEDYAPMGEKPPETTPIIVSCEPAPSFDTPAETESEEAVELRKIIETMSNSLADKTHFEVLNLDRKVSKDRVRHVFLELAKKFHPDHVQGLGLSDLASSADEIFRKINEAHSVLSDETRRKQYEKELDRGDEASTNEVARNALAAEFAFQKGMVFFRKKQFKEALGEFKEAVKLCPSEGEHLAWVAWTVFHDPKTAQEKMLPKLKEQLLEAIRQTPKSATCHYFLGEVYLRMGEEQRAMTCFKKTLEIEKDHIEASRQVRIIRMRREKSEDPKKKGFLKRFKKK
ncbi:MAG: DnaJ domain-containing protein, partial [Pseudomonadota bacterium]